MRIAKHICLAVITLCSLCLFFAVNLALGPTFSSNGFDAHAMLGITVTHWHDARGITLSDFNPVVFLPAYAVAFLLVYGLFTLAVRRRRKTMNRTKHLQPTPQ